MLENIIKKKIGEELSDWKLLKVVEDIELKMLSEISDGELLKAVKRIKSPWQSLNSSSDQGAVQMLEEKCGGETTVYSTLERKTPTFTRW